MTHDYYELIANIEWIKMILLAKNEGYPWMKVDACASCITPQTTMESAYKPVQNRDVSVVGNTKPAF